MTPTPRETIEKLLGEVDWNCRVTLSKELRTAIAADRMEVARGAYTAAAIDESFHSYALSQNLIEGTEDK
jgi:hypothetical protein